VRNPNHDCTLETVVLDSRVRNGLLCRRRECQFCGERFTTVELVVPDGMPAKAFLSLVRNLTKERATAAEQLKRVEAMISGIRKTLGGEPLQDVPVPKG
jgi:transcriptional regulator NrdR family protein